jgi:hypothetical protein
MHTPRPFDTLGKSSGSQLLIEKNVSRDRREQRHPAPVLK